MTLLLSIGLSPQPALAHDPPVILPTRLEFDASHAPKKCNDQDGFRSILGAWMPSNVLRGDAERRLSVRIQSSASGGKRADVSLFDAQGVVLAKRHTTHASTTECHKVLWSVARDAAKMLGAFEPPPPKEPVACPVPPACATCPQQRPCPACSTCPRLRETTPALLPALSRSNLGVGLFAGSGIFSEMAAGPNLLLGFVPSSRLSAMHIELACAWTSQTAQSIRVHSIPVDASLCWVQGIVRFCGGLSTTVLFSNQSFTHGELHLTLGGNFRVGTELFSRGPLSIRADVFGRVTIAPRPLSKPLSVSDEPTPFAGGVAVIGLWSFE